MGERSADPLEAEADRVAQSLDAFSPPGEVAETAPAAEAEGGGEAGEAGAVGQRPDGQGRRLPASLRAGLEAGLGVRLHGVRIHTEGDRARRAREMGARAFTTGSSITFAPGAFAPDTGPGRRLIAHEVVHVVQQGAASPPRGPAGGPIVAPSRPRVDAPPLQRQDDGVPELPGYSQMADECGAASVVSALMIWDRQRGDPDAPNETLVHACNIILTYLAQHRSATVRQWSDRGADGEALHRRLRSALTAIRDHARLPGEQISQSEYQAIGMALYYLYVDRNAGLSAAEISNLHSWLGLHTGRLTSGAASFDDIMSSPVLRGLRPGQIAQVGWYVRTGAEEGGSVSLGLHAFLIGRFDDGRWFLSDQGESPATELVAFDLDSLRRAIETAARSGQSWIYTGRPSTITLGAWTGVRLLGGPEGVEEQATGLVAPGTFLGEVDAGWNVTGDRLHAGAFVSRHYSLSETRGVDTADGGGLIVEMPRGVFSYYRTELVSDDNLGVAGLDEDDSSGGLLTRRTFYHAWLRLCSENACRASLLAVY